MSSTVSTIALEKWDSTLEVESESGKRIDIYSVLNVSAVVETSKIYLYYLNISSGTETSTFYATLGTSFSVIETSTCEIFLNWSVENVHVLSCQRWKYLYIPSAPSCQRPKYRYIGLYIKLDK